MGMPRTLPVVVGIAALMATSAILIIDIILIGPLLVSPRVRLSAIVSASLEGVVLSVLAWLLSTYFIIAIPDRSKRFIGVAFGASVMACTLATVSFVVTMISLSNTAGGSTDKVLGAKRMNIVIGSSVALGLAFALQLIFIVIHFVLARIPGHGVADSLHTTEEGRRPVLAEVKSMPYDRTVPALQKPGTALMYTRGRPGSRSGRSTTETMSSIRRSLSSVTRPLSTRRLLTRETSSSSSTTNGIRDRRALSDDGFDSLDTSAVDQHTRQTVPQSPSPTPARFLETIPASPAASRSPSPGDALDLDPPRSRRDRSRDRSRSYSPAGGSTPRAPFAPTASDSSEAHIHPLFRSGSPTPPPMATPGTMVLASPNAGQVISDRHSIRSLSRMRSGSLPTAPSPLSRQNSFDDLSPAARPATTPEPSILESPDEDEDDGDERKLTPPIPEWIMSAGSRTSLSDYVRRARGRERE